MNINKVAFGWGHIMADSATHAENRLLTQKEQLEYIEKIINNAPEDKFELGITNKDKNFLTGDDYTTEKTDSISLKNGDCISIHKLSNKDGQICNVVLKTQKELEGSKAKALVIISDESGKNPELTEMFDKLVKTFIKQP